mgnify:CR=1 FL=1
MADDTKVLWVTDKKGREVGVASKRIAYVELGSAEQHLQALGQWLADNDTLGWKYDLPEDR